jgi:hypothetical protein
MNSMQLLRHWHREVRALANDDAQMVRPSEPYESDWRGCSGRHCRLRTPERSAMGQVDEVTSSGMWSRTSRFGCLMGL